MLKSILTSLILLISSISHGFETKATHAILIDANTHAILFEKNSHTHMAPSSMSKVMTSYIAFEYLRNGQVKLDDTFSISEKAWRMGGTRMFIPIDAKVSFEDLLKGVIIHSGNDAAVAIAEILMGSEEEFANKMNETAKKLGMNNSHFTNSTGWPDTNNYSSAYDLALLSIHLINNYPEYYHYFSHTEFTYNKIKQANKNGLLYRNIGADGLKTGHAEEAGYSLIASVKKGDRRLIAVVNGLRSKKDRTAETEALINYGLMNFSNIHIVDKNQVIEKVKVIDGSAKSIDLISIDAISLTVPKHETKNLKFKIHYHTPIIAPVELHTTIGELIVESPSGKTTYPLFSAQEVKKAGFIERIQGNFISFFE